MGGRARDAERTGNIAGVAQLVERLLAMQKVAGSSPVARSARKEGRRLKGFWPGRSIVGAVAQLVRVPVCHTGGRGFESRQPRWMLIENSGAVPGAVAQFSPRFARRDSGLAPHRSTRRLLACQVDRWGCSSVGRALEWHSRGQGFDSPQLHAGLARMAELVDAHGSGPCGGDPVEVQILFRALVEPTC
jgi:hypothetical protein